MYKPHYGVTEATGSVLATFSTGAAMYDKTANYIGEIVGTFVLVFAILSFGLHELAAGLGPVIVGGLILSIGISLVGTTGYAINPARDLGPRIVHHFLPLKHRAVLIGATPLCQSSDRLLVPYLLPYSTVFSSKNV